MTVVAEHEMADTRKIIGWNTPDCLPARVVIGPQDSEIVKLIAQGSSQDSVHVVGDGKRGTLNRRVLPLLARTAAIVGLMLEGGDNRGILGLIRRAKYSLDRYFIEDKIDFLAAMGQTGVRWYESAGYDPSHIFPFMYVTERPTLALDNAGDLEKTNTFCILYLGNFIRRKDVVTAIRAVARLTEMDWQLT